MTADEIAAALKLVREETDLNSKSLLLVSELFRERGFEPVVVGGSAIEFYTDGAYMSGDTDICWTGWPQPSNEERIEIMRQLPGVKSHGGSKSWASKASGSTCWARSIIAQTKNFHGSTHPTEKSD